MIKYPISHFAFFNDTHLPSQYETTLMTWNPFLKKVLNPKIVSQLSSNQA